VNLVRKAILDNLKIDKFTLLGHSFGGYIAGLYCIKYPESVNKMIFLSPVGVGYEVACISTNPLEDIVHKFLYKLKGPPTIGYKFFGFFANLCFDVLMDNKCKNMTQKVKDYLKSGRI
jgi:pimeloyl-ACP methyl ester carboxylesterase